MKKTIGTLIFILALFAVCNAGWAAAPAVPTVAAQPGCQPVLDLGKALAPKGETCAVTALPKTPEPEFMAPPQRLKYCTCSCGAPCTSDADCGGGVGSCRVGITCC
jgi:hypothetical protein